MKRESLHVLEKLYIQKTQIPEHSFPLTSGLRNTTKSAKPYASAAELWQTTDSKI